MPNHVHGIIIIKGKESPKETEAQKKQYLCASVGGFKTWSARRINFLLDRTGTPFWQRSFYDHVIRDGNGLDRIREYIINNPSQWGIGKDDY